MSIAESLLAEFEQEANTTRKFLQRVPDDKLTWRPHAKSMSLGQLAHHIAASPGGVVQLAQADETPLPDFSQPFPEPARTSDVLRTLEETLAKVRDVLPTFGDNRMTAMWRATKDGKEVLAMPRAAFLRNILLNHWYHHRGQLSVYLRLLDISVPSAYGPTADEMPDFVQ